MLRIAAITLVASLAGGCNRTAPDSDCRLALTGGQSSVPIDGWCIRSEGQLALAAHDSSLIVVSTSITRIDTGTGNQTVLAGGDSQPVGGFADGGDEIFFSQCANTTCGIFAVAWGGGTPREVAATDTGSSTAASALAVDAQSVYWIDASAVWSAPRSGGTAKMMTSVPATAGELAVDATALYIADFDQGTVERLPLDGTASTVVSGRASPTSLRTSGHTAYWLEGTPPMYDSRPGIGSVQAWSGTGTPSTLASALVGLGQLAASSDSIVWTATMGYSSVTVPDGSVVGLLHGATTPTTVAGEQLFPGAIVIDGSTAYWTVSSNYDGHAAIAHAPIP